MPVTPEDRARETIDNLLSAAGWIVQSRDEVNLSAGPGVAIRYFRMKSGHGEADYLLYVNGLAAGAIEAKKEGETLTSFEIQTGKYSVGLPDELKAHRKPLPFLYQSTGIETRFTNLLEPDARSRQVFSFHRPETFAEWLAQEAKSPGSILRACLKHLPPLIKENLWPAQIRAIEGLEESLGEVRPRALIQMASGGGKPFWLDESYDHWVRNSREFDRIQSYIEFNPVSAGLVARPEEWPWSSAQARHISQAGVPVPRGSHQNA